jgi:hypothetical protein
VFKKYRIIFKNNVISLETTSDTSLGLSNGINNKKNSYHFQFCNEMQTQNAFLFLQHKPKNEGLVWSQNGESTNHMLIWTNKAHDLNLGRVTILFQIIYFTTPRKTIFSNDIFI